MIMVTNRSTMSTKRLMLKGPYRCSQHVCLIPYLGWFLFSRSFSCFRSFSAFVIKRAAAPKNGVKFHQGSIGTIRSSLATSYDASRRRARSSNFDQSEAEKLSHTHRHTQNQHTVRPCSPSSACKNQFCDS